METNPEGNKMMASMLPTNSLNHQALFLVRQAQPRRLSLCQSSERARGRAGAGAGAGGRAPAPVPLLLPTRFAAGAAHGMPARRRPGPGPLLLKASSERRAGQPAASLRVLNHTLAAPCVLAIAAADGAAGWGVGSGRNEMA